MCWIHCDWKELGKDCSNATVAAFAPHMLIHCWPSTESLAIIFYLYLLEMSTLVKKTVKLDTLTLYLSALVKKNLTFGHFGQVLTLISLTLWLLLYQIVMCLVNSLNFHQTVENTNIDSWQWQKNLTLWILITCLH